ncbi:hypothetical protein B2G71_13295 [Novosphingobium sp. PC22D]|uniref:M23 family metallopeptidase n=1 Tax=Novosphingobium sp. PC22D TaxID=1962403 RepID=UPI000BFADCD4|nr:M23 family metallopeptidase [Novosphingobium sp. PC22D]PEQ12113.1 hypothetical protein B2G71_13295 [Novosphingobium sp. PC22D]
MHRSPQSHAQRDYTIADEPCAASGGGPGQDHVDLPKGETSKRRDAVTRFRDRLEGWCHRIDLAPDLAQDIGSARWFRGLGTLVGLGAVALAFWPDVSAVEAATSMPVDDRVRDEFRSQMIMPLALGADSGRRMGATSLVTPLRSAPERPSIELVSTLGRGDSLGGMLERAGLSGGDSSRVLQLVSATMETGDITPGTRFDITLGRRPGPGLPRALESMAFRARFDLDLSIERGESGLALVRHPIAVDATPLRIRGKVGSSLYRAARNGGAPIAGIQDYLRAIDRHLSLESDIRADDDFDLIVAYRRSAKGERQVGELLYAGIERDGKPKLQLVRWGKDGEMFEASGVGRTYSRAPGQPVSGRVTSRFGMRRHPILGYRRMHSGVDYGARYGTPIYAVADGRVSYSGRHGGHGNYVKIEHGGHLATGYAHMSRIAVKSGSTVRAGQVIGYVGSTGLSTGPHLHFEAYKGNRKVDPLTIRFVSQPRIDGNELAAFKRRLAALMAVEPGAALADMAPAAEQPHAPAREIDRLSPQRAVVAAAASTTSVAMKD